MVKVPRKAVAEYLAREWGDNKVVRSTVSVNYDIRSMFGVHTFAAGVQESSEDPSKPEKCGRGAVMPHDRYEFVQVHNE